ncbi:DUF4202 domain-containing protein [Galbibacter sp. EGI 63066]|uniref:DUF4202 domain-containing protein n=1 Tax=Galbibacter sp. EGI 63066 TaxID=2993559 RepID=UPI002248E616|nr:DUF4202 domain-containing protein [Galbibacter sp. EGI 63066]MCX2679194.1 DUF4202 domain-containing protein [Galbibacter sp. EGI 63066]
MSLSIFEKAIEKIDTENAKDPNKESFQGEEYSKELLYSQRMTETLLDFYPQAPQELQIAARAQHIERWKIDRETYPMDRVGYLKWREDLKKMHAKLTAEILTEVGYDSDFIDRVSFLIQKKKMKKDEDSQTLEDVVCLVFLRYYFEDFAAKHPDDKIIDILQKTWRKMSEKGQEAALKLPLDEKSTSLIQRALA